jgi:hypothetical protein
LGPEGRPGAAGVDDDLGLNPVTMRILARAAMGGLC